MQPVTIPLHQSQMVLLVDVAQPRLTPAKQELKVTTVITVITVITLTIFSLLMQILDMNLQTWKTGHLKKKIKSTSITFIALTRFAVLLATSFADWTKCRFATGLAVFDEAVRHVLQSEDVCLAINVAADNTCIIPFTQGHISLMFLHIVYEANSSATSRTKTVPLQLICVQKILDLHLPKKATH